ncbi:HMG-box [Moniliophthora roreri MCA 2997]|uniref:HMG-box n=1 Tax=Moniliophthora roreri (strain MCA 2997) TaxID=1381753 RepID=V2WXF8_MONRO|nr:HMG-box [Moniliophthora roreri MCA 2997]
MPVIRSLSDAPRRSRRLSKQKPRMYDYDGFEYYNQEGYLPSRFPSESTMSFYNDRSPPVFTNPFSTHSPVDEAPKRSSTSHSRRRSHDHVPRPPNAFILYRSDYWKMEKLHDEKEREKDHCEISRLAARSWKELPDERKEEYRRQALIKKAEHARQYPGYKYAPGHRNKPKATRKKSGRCSASDIRGCSDIAPSIMRSHPSVPSTRTPTPGLSLTSSNLPWVKCEELPTNLPHFSLTPTSTALPPTSLPPTPPTLPSQPYTVARDKYPGSCPVQDPSYLEEASTFHEGFVPTDQIPEIDLYATVPQLQVPTIEAKVEAPPRSPQPSPSLPFRADMDVAFGYKPEIFQLEPHQVVLTDSNGHAEVSSFANDTLIGWESPYDIPSGLPALNDGFHYDYSGSMLIGQSAYDPSPSSSQQDWQNLEATLNQLYPTTASNLTPLTRYHSRMQK